MNHHHTEETKKKLSILNKGHIPWNKGLDMPELSKEHKEKLSKSLKGLKRSPETCKRISESKKGNKNPIYGKHSGMLGRHQLEETKRRLSKINKGKCSGSKHPLYGKPLKKNRCQWFNVNGIKCQGTYEKRFIEACFKYGILVSRCTDRFFLKDIKGEFTYLPDFNISGYFVEIKGWQGPNSKRKLKAIVDNKLPVVVLFEKDIIKFENTGVFHSFFYYE